MLLIQRSVIESFHAEDRLPALPCPHCYHCPHCYQNLSLKRKRENLNLVTSHAFEAAWDAGVVEPGDASGRFRAALTCANSSCRDKVVTIGEFKERLVDDPGATGPPGYQDLAVIKELRFRCFLPALPVFRIPEMTPSDVSQAIGQAFQHPFADPSASGNALRRSIERLLDHFRVNKTAEIKRGKRKGKRRRLQLHERLQLPLPSALNEWADELRAVKWIGNEASHSEEISLDSLLVAFEILDVACHSLFDQSEKRARKQAKEINRRKERK